MCFVNKCRKNVNVSYVTTEQKQQNCNFLSKNHTQYKTIVATKKLTESVIFVLNGKVMIKELISNFDL